MRESHLVNEPELVCLVDGEVEGAGQEVPQRLVTGQVGVHGKLPDGLVRSGFRILVTRPQPGLDIDRRVSLLNLAGFLNCDRLRCSNDNNLFLESV